VLVCKGDSLRTRKNRLDMVLALSHPAKNVMFRLDGLGGGKLTSAG
jgi:hypothetical protein